ncbi:hypothetical protein BV898_01202 [Hypsibius exemplaris]|uniref:Uncharacterized protein n=1 Tax=Hypsibius exemplaris TaxID=2072580 RepID=A0A1W0XC11_HYPEX|nr:hypothetical protein BV898_01202 [Hypsibius exemplaris]
MNLGDSVVVGVVVVRNESGDGESGGANAHLKVAEIHGHRDGFIHAYTALENAHGVYGDSFGEVRVLHGTAIVNLILAMECLAHMHMPLYTTVVKSHTGARILIVNRQIGSYAIVGSRGACTAAKAHQGWVRVHGPSHHLRFLASNDDETFT